MSVSATTPVFQTQTFIQGDARDPLGIWGARGQITGDGTGGFVQGTVFVPAERKAAYVYTVYSAHLSLLTGIPSQQQTKYRILTNWPNIDVQPLVQAYGTLLIDLAGSDADFSPPSSGPAIPVIGPNDRFILLWDPRPIGQDMDILEMQRGNNLDLATYTFEAYGYFWDRAAMETPGGPRHPGSA